MLRTEKAALTAECCRDRVPGCVASECQGWRWFDPARKIVGYRCPKGGKLAQEHGVSTCNFGEETPFVYCGEGVHTAVRCEPITEPVVERRGYCGLAGKPEVEE